ncbi:MAG: T9SS type A sorting domain-containing protein, partial [Chitinophagales bacterium]|nr:T9SS type A sorting domain-containing protein [Chitinophagales bacterium]
TGPDLSSYSVTTYLEPGTSYAFRVKSVCYDILYKAPSDWYYFSTTGKMGEFDNLVKIYPNPSSGIFNVGLTGYKEQVEISIINAVGEVVSQRTVFADTPNYVAEFDAGNLPAGMYQVVIAGEEVTIKTVLIDK